MATFADRLVELREKAGKKRQEVADDIGISRASLEYYEKGKRKPDIDVLLLLADYYSVTCDYLLKGIATENVNINKETGLSNEAIENLKLLSQEKNTFFASKCNYVFKIDIINFCLSKLFAYESLELLKHMEQIANLKCKGTANVNDEVITQAYFFLKSNKEFEKRQLHIINNIEFRNILISEASSMFDLFIKEFSALYAPTDWETEFNIYANSGLNQESVIKYNKTKLIDEIEFAKPLKDGESNGNDNQKR